MTDPKDLAAQIEAAFDYRGHVTLTLKSGEAVEGFLFNRDFAAGFVELYLKGSAEYLKVQIEGLASVALTGEDCAAGKSYEDYQKQKAAEKA